MSVEKTNLLGLPDLEVIDAELLKKWRLGFESEGEPEEEGDPDPENPGGEEGLGGEPPFEDPVGTEEEAPDPEMEEGIEETEPEPPLEEPLDDVTC